MGCINTRSRFSALFCHGGTSRMKNELPMLVKAKRGVGGGGKRGSPRKRLFSSLKPHTSACVCGRLCFVGTAANDSHWRNGLPKYAPVPPAREREPPRAVTQRDILPSAGRRVIADRCSRGSRSTVCGTAVCPRTGGSRVAHAPPCSIATLCDTASARLLAVYLKRCSHRVLPFRLAPH